MPRYRGFVYDGLASLDYQSAASWLNADSVAWFDESKLRIVRHNVKAVILDSLELKPDVVKIDVQGLEAQVVRGGERTFRRSKPVTIIETPSQEVVSLLGDCGLSPFKYTKGELFAGDTSGLNTVFLGQQARERLGAELVVHPPDRDQAACFPAQEQRRGLGVAQTSRGLSAIRALPRVWI